MQTIVKQNLGFVVVYSSHRTTIMTIQEIQTAIKRQGADAYVLVDYENKNKVVVQLLGEKFLTRKIIMVIPAEGMPMLITHIIDTVYLKDDKTKANFELKVYKTWQQMLDLEKEIIGKYKTVLMDISEFGLLPRVSLADYGSVEYVKSLGVNVISSADLMQSMTAVLSEEAYQTQVKACEITLKIKDEAFLFIKNEILSKGETDELDVQEFIGRRFREEGMEYDELPLVAIGQNASDPHYTPAPEAHSKIHDGDLEL